MGKITRMGIDLGDNTFHVCAMDRSGHGLRRLVELMIDCRTMIPGLG